ncbi:MAG: hypothetical protein Q9180_005947 [Flavoplaca navasiana]
MVSLTAFRTLFVSSPTHSQGKRGQKNSVGYWKRLWYKYKNFDSERDENRGQIERAKIVPLDVTVPNATLTGMRTYIRGSPRQSEFAASEWNGERDPRHDTIHVTHDMEWDTDSVSRDRSSVENLV